MTETDQVSGGLRGRRCSPGSALSSAQPASQANPGYAFAQLARAIASAASPANDEAARERAVRKAEAWVRVYEDAGLPRLDDRAPARARRELTLRIDGSRRRRRW